MDKKDIEKMVKIKQNCWNIVSHIHLNFLDTNLSFLDGLKIMKGGLRV